MKVKIEILISTGSIANFNLYTNRFYCQMTIAIPIYREYYSTSDYYFVRL